MLKEHPKDPTLPISPRKKNQTRKTSIEKEKAYSLSEESIKSNSTQHFHSTQNPLWLCQKKINHIHSSKHTHLPRKKDQKELSKKSKTIKQNPDEKIKESTYIQKPQMRIHLI